MNHRVDITHFDINQAYSHIPAGAGHTYVPGIVTSRIGQGKRPSFGFWLKLYNLPDDDVGIMSNGLPINRTDFLQQTIVHVRQEIIETLNSLVKNEEINSFATVHDKLKLLLGRDYAIPKSFLEIFVMSKKQYNDAGLKELYQNMKKSKNNPVMLRYYITFMYDFKEILADIFRDENMKFIYIMTYFFMQEENALFKKFCKYAVGLLNTNDIQVVKEVSDFIAVIKEYKNHIMVEILYMLNNWDDNGIISSETLEKYLARLDQETVHALALIEEKSSRERSSWMNFGNTFSWGNAYMM